MDSVSRKITKKRADIPPYVYSIKSVAELPRNFGKQVMGCTPSKNFQKYEIIVQSSQLDNEVKLIEWRSKTQLPIIKVLFYKVLQKKLIDEEEVIQVAIQNFAFSLHTLPQLSLFQLLYLLKESLVGFERLFDRFGPFDITDKMIVINKNSKCKVWINESIMFNFPGKKNKNSQYEVLLNIIRIFEEKCIKSTLSPEFFTNLSKVSGFAQSVQYIDSFVKSNNKILSNRLIYIAESIAARKPFEKHHLKTERKQESLTYASLKKIPKFIGQLGGQKKSRVDETESKSQYGFLKPNFIVSRDPSVAKLVDSKLKDYSSNSNVSNRSLISHDDVKKTKSVYLDAKSVNNQAKSVKFVHIATDQQDSQASPKKINYLSTFTPRGKPYFKYETQKFIKIESNQQLYLTKQPTKLTLPCKIRKMSTDRQMNNFKANIKLVQEVSCVQKKKKRLDELGFKRSQQTATTVDEVLRMQMKGAEIKDLLRDEFHFSFIQQNDGNENIFEKNGWTKTVNTLKEEKEEEEEPVGGRNFRQTMYSIDDGQQFFSDDYLRVGEDLTLLGSMGKQLKSSFNHD